MSADVDHSLALGLRGAVFAAASGATTCNSSQHSAPIANSFHPALRQQCRLAREVPKKPAGGNSAKSTGVGQIETVRLIIIPRSWSPTTA
jgi:hypothetical protein